MRRLHALIEAFLYSLRHPLVKAGLWSALATAAICVAVTLGFWWPPHSDSQDLMDRIESKRREVVSSMYAAELTRAYTRAQREVPELEKKLDNVGSQSDLVGNLGRLAGKTGVRILSESYNEGKPQGIYIPLHIDLVLQGNYSALRDFFHGVPGLPVWSEIQDARLERTRESGGLVKAQIRLATYRKAAVSQGGAGKK